MPKMFKNPTTHQVTTTNVDGLSILTVYLQICIGKQALEQFGSGITHPLKSFAQCKVCLHCYLVHAYLDREKVGDIVLLKP